MEILLPANISLLAVLIQIPLLRLPSTCLLIVLSPVSTAIIIPTCSTFRALSYLILTGEEIEIK